MISQAQLEAIAKARGWEVDDEDIPAEVQAKFVCWRVEGETTINYWDEYPPYDEDGNLNGELEEEAGINTKYEGDGWWACFLRQASHTIQRDRKPKVARCLAYLAWLKEKEDD